MVNLNSVLKKQLEKICLSSEEGRELQKVANEFVLKLKKVGCDVKIGGSLAKGTLIRKDKQDIDIFVVFKKEEDTKKLGSLLGKAGLKGKKVHGSRDYFQVKGSMSNKASKSNCPPKFRASAHPTLIVRPYCFPVVFEIIPVVEVGKMEDVENVTDFSLSHVNYVKKKLSKNKKLADEIKLAKTFCYAQECYGAESYIQGFSGYALEVLVIYFRGFVKFLKSLSGFDFKSRKSKKSHPPTHDTRDLKKRVLDIEKLFRNEREVLNEINASKLQSPLIVVDPTYKFRNVTAGLGVETFDKFLKASKKFLKSPSLSDFDKKEFDLKKFKKTKDKFMEIELKTDRQEGDIAGTKMKKFFRFLIRQLEKKKQEVLKREFIYGGEGKNAKGYLVVREKKEIEVGGIDIIMKQAIVGFKKVRGKTYVRGGKVYAKEKVLLNVIFNSARKVGEEMGVSFQV